MERVLKSKIMNWDSLPYLKKLELYDLYFPEMKRSNPYVATTKQQRFAKIAANPKSLIYRNQRQMVLYKQPRPAMKRAAPQEVNYVDLALANYALNTTGSITLVATIAQGASVNQRIGKRAYYKSLLVRGSLFAGASGTLADATMMFVYDKRPTGALPAITDILTAINSTAFMNDNNTGRFEVIRRNDFCLIGNSTTPSTGQEMKNMDIYIPLNKRPITFESVGTGAIGDIDSGAIYMVLLSSVVAGTAAPSSSLAIRTRFTEQ